MEVLTFNVDKDRRNLTNDVQNFDIDFKNSPSWVQARQYENQMRQVQVNVQHGDGTPFDLTGANPVLEGFMPDGVHRIIDAKHGVMIDPVNGQFRFDFPAPVFAVSGSYKQIFFRLYRAGNNIATLEFSMEVLADKVISGLIPADYVTPIEDIMDKAETVFNNATGDIDTIKKSWAAKLQDLFDSLSKTGKDTADALMQVQAGLTTLEAQIKSDGLMTQADLDKVFTPLVAEIGPVADFKASGDSLVDKTVNEFTDRGVNVKWFGAIGDGVADDTVAFTKAYSIAKANATTVFVPTGRYAVAFDESNKPDNLRFWGYGQINNNGVLFQIATNQNLGINVDLQNPLSVSRKTFGSYNSAAAASVIANSATGKSAVMGINDLSTGLENYSNRDSVGLFVSNETNGLIITTDTVDFGVNYVDVNPKTDLTNVEVGMFVDTSENPKKTGIVKGITGNRITVNKWLAIGNGADNQVPATGSSVIINPMTAIWGQNTLVSLNADQTNVEATGHELDMQNNQPHRDNVDGYTSIIMGKYPGNAAYTARSAGEGPWRYGLYSNGSETGLRQDGGSVGAVVSAAKYTGFAVWDTPISFSSSGQATDLLVHSTDDDGNVLFQIKKSGELSKLKLVRDLTSGTSSAPVIFANGNITLPDPSKSANDIKLIVNTTSANVQITAPINYEGSVLQAIAIKPHKSMSFVCDGNNYYLLEFDSAIG